MTKQAKRLDNFYSTPKNSEGPRLLLDIISIISDQTNDPATIRALAEAYPTMFLTPMTDRFIKHAPKMLPLWWSEELRQYAYTAVVAEETLPAKTSVIDLPMPSKDFRNLMEDLLEDTGSPRVPDSLPPSLKIMEKLVEIGEAVEFSYHLCHNLFTTKFPEPARRPPSEGEAPRPRRTLLRFHLYAQFFHEPGGFAANSSGPKKT